MDSSHQGTFCRNLYYNDEMLLLAGGEISRQADQSPSRFAYITYDKSQKQFVFAIQLVVAEKLICQLQQGLSVTILTYITPWSHANPRHVKQIKTNLYQKIFNTVTVLRSLY